MTDGEFEAGWIGQGLKLKNCENVIWSPLLKAKIKIYIYQHMHQIIIMLRKIWPSNKYSVYIYIENMLLFERLRFLNCCFGNISLINMSHWRVLSIWNFLCGKRCHAVWHLLHLSGCCMKMKTNDPGTHTHTYTQVLGMIQSLPSVWWVLYPDECWLWKNKLQSLSCNQKTSVKNK